MSIHSSLLNRPSVGGLFVEAPIDAVAAYFRCSYSFDVKNDRDRVPARELRGSAAQIDAHFGCDSVYFGDSVLMTESYLEFFPLRGSRRISTVGCQREFTLVEVYNNTHRPFEGEWLSEYLGANTYEFWSIIGLNPMLKLLPHYQSASFLEHFLYGFTKQGMRIVHNIKTEDKWKFDQEGEPLAFEDVRNYRKRMIKDRLNRELIFDYMQKLGLDPESIFLHRELEDPILFSSDLPGDRVKVDEKEFKRYLEWGERKGFALDD